MTKANSLFETDDAVVSVPAHTMYALRHAKARYVKGQNGHHHAPDAIGNMFTAVSPEDVVTITMKLLGHEDNLYAKLNPGQQSMNYRNRLRTAVKKGQVTVEQIHKEVVAL